MPTPRRTALSLLALAGALALAGCTAPAQDAEPAPTAPAAPGDALSTPVEPEWRVDLTGVGLTTVLVEDTVVAYVFDEARGLELVGLAAEDGEERWRLPASTGVANENASLEVLVIEDAADRPLVAALGPAESRDGVVAGYPIRLIDPGTGAVVQSAEPAFVGGLEACTSVPGICMTGIRAQEGTDYTARYDVATGALEDFVDTVEGYDLSYRWEGSVFSVSRAGEPEALTRIVDGEVRWTTPLPEGTPSLLQGVGTSIAEGPATVIQVTAGTDAASTVLVAVDRGTGEILWTRTGATLCDHDRVLVCTGDVGFQALPDGESFDETSGAVTVERVDLATGDVRWSTTVADLQTFVELGRALEVSPDLWGYVDGDRAKVLDVETGETRDLADDERAACAVQASFSQPVFGLEGQQVVPYLSGAWIGSCGATGAPDFDPSTFTQAVARWTTSVWIPEADVLAIEDADAVLPDDEPRVRAVQTPDAIVAYRF